MEGNTRPFGELFAESTRNGLTRPKAVRGSGVKMVNMGELFAHSRLRNVPMDRVGFEFRAFLEFFDAYAQVLREGYFTRSRVSTLVPISFYTLLLQ